MFIAYLAHVLGGRVLIPHAVGIRLNNAEGNVEFVDDHGRVLVTFRREDISVYGPEDQMRGLDRGED